MTSHSYRSLNSLLLFLAVKHGLENVSVRRRVFTRQQRIAKAFLKGASTK